MDGQERAGCRVKRLSSGSWAVTFPDGLVSFCATEGQERRVAERWRATGRRVDAHIRAADVLDGGEGPGGA
jgi:hypothetical protein